jgi:dTDP-4-dehydrorhamnose 3,5-epimerase-like enzyme
MQNELVGVVFVGLWQDCLPLYHTLEPCSVNIAHGFSVLSDYSEFANKCSDFYHPNDEGGLKWDDPDIGIEWPLQEGVELNLSDKDTKWGGIREY